MTMTNLQVTPLHPALHFEPGLTAVGIMEPAGSALIVRRHGPLPERVKLVRGKEQTTADGRAVHPQPTHHAPLIGRWPAADVAAFCADGAAPSFTTFLQDIRRALTQQIEFKRSESASLVACWIAGTYFHPLFTAYPRLNLIGPKRSGKSKLLQVTAAVAFNGLHFVLPTAATIFRLVEPLRPTLCLDEMEKLDKSDAHPIEGLINAGYKAGATVPRTEGDTKREVVLYNAYAPVALAGIKGLHDVLADRAITIEMQRGLDKARINAEVIPDDPVYSAIRAMGYRLALTAADSLRGALSVIREQQDSFKLLEGRPLELYRPLMAVAMLAGGDPSFLCDLSAIVQDDGDRDEMDHRAAWLFSELTRRFADPAVDSITVTPSQLLDGCDWATRPLLTTAAVGKLVSTYGLAEGRKHTSAGRVYTFTRAKFTEQAQRYRYRRDGEG
jgi:hypothetical protein